VFTQDFDGSCQWQATAVGVIKVTLSAIGRLSINPNLLTLNQGLKCAGTAYWHF